MMRSLLPSDADVAAISAVLYPFVEAGVDMSDRYGVILNQLSSRFQTPDMQAKIKASFFDRFAVALAGDDATSGGKEGQGGSIRSGGTGGIIPKTSHFLCIGKEKSARHKDKQKQKEKAKELEKAKQLEKEKEEEAAAAAKQQQEQQQDKEKPQEKDLLGDDVPSTTVKDTAKPEGTDATKQDGQPSSSSAASPPTAPPPLIDLTSSASLAVPSTPPPIGSPLVPTTTAAAATTTPPATAATSSPTTTTAAVASPTSTTSQVPVLVPATPTPPPPTSASSTTRDLLWEFAVHRFDAVSLGDAVRQHLDVSADLFTSELARLQTGGKFLSTVPPRPPTPPPNSGSVGGGDTGGAGDVPDPPTVNGEGMAGDTPSGGMASGGKHRWRDRVRPSSSGKTGSAPTFPGQTAQPRQQTDGDSGAAGGDGGDTPASPGEGRQRAMSMDGRPSTAAGDGAGGKARGRKWPPQVPWAKRGGASGTHVSFSPDTDGGGAEGTKKTAKSRWSISGIVGPKGVDPPAGVSGGPGVGSGVGASGTSGSPGGGAAGRESKWKKIRLPTIKVHLPKIPFFRGKDNPSGIRQQAL